MRRFRYLPVIAFVVCLLIPTFVLAEPPDKGGVPDDYLGELYGDLYIILRDVNGVPVLDSDGCVQPTAISEDGQTLEVRQLYTLIDLANEIEYECELVEENTADDDIPDTIADLAFVQEVDFGRLNLGRAPQPVLDHAFDEAVKAMNNAGELGEQGEISLDPAGRLVLKLPGDEEGVFVYKTIDSPLENLALYVKMMRDGHWITLNTDTGGKGRGGSGGPPPDKGPPEGDGPTVEPRPVLSEDAIALLIRLGYPVLTSEASDINDLDSDDLLLAASLLAAAADKTGSFTVDKIVYANAIYGINYNDLRYWVGTTEDDRYFDFSAFTYHAPEADKPFASRSSGGCAGGSVYVLQREPASTDLWKEQCMSIEGSVFFRDVEFILDGSLPEGDTQAGSYAGQYGEGLSNVAGFTQAANDALKMIEYIHNYAVPEDLPLPPLP